MSDLSGKKGLILGVGNQRSIAWAMAEQLKQQGAELGLTFLSDPKGRFEANVRKLGDQVGATFIHECDVSIDESIQQMADALKAKWDRLDFLIHSLALPTSRIYRFPFHPPPERVFPKRI